MPDQLSAILQNDAAEVAAITKSKLRLLLEAMRPYQWSKNFFVLIPLLFAKRLMEPNAIGYSLLAFVVFCFLASGLYIFNDWLDVEEDRAHPEKRNRALSSGLLPVPTALAAFAILVIAGLGLASLIDLKFLLVATLYFAQTLAYCLALKRIIILDCIAIASGFVLRVVGGAVAISVEPSHWLIACGIPSGAIPSFLKTASGIVDVIE